jgi:hypothetical protein
MTFPLGAPALLAHLQALGVRLWADGEALAYNAPEDVLTPALISAMAKSKAQLLALLQREEPKTTLLSGTPIEATDLPVIAERLGGPGIQSVWVALRADSSLLYGYCTDHDGPPLPPPDLPAVVPPKHPCFWCRGTRFWCPTNLSRWICERCHQPVVERLVMLTLDLAGGQVEDTGERPQVPLRPGLAQ